jgi:hypothetical protein
MVKYIFLETNHKCIDQGLFIQLKPLIKLGFKEKYYKI